MKTILLLLCGAILCGCASDPLMTGQPQDWVGHKKDDLMAAWGQEPRIIPQSGDIIVLEYVETGGTLSPGQKVTSSEMHDVAQGTEGALSAKSKNITLEKSEYRSTFVKTTRFEIKRGIVTKWYQEYAVDGQIRWRHH